MLGEPLSRCLRRQNRHRDELRIGSETKRGKNWTRTTVEQALNPNIFLRVQCALSHGSRLRRGKRAVGHGEGTTHSKCDGSACLPSSRTGAAQLPRNRELSIASHEGAILYTTGTATVSGKRMGHECHDTTRRRTRRKKDEHTRRGCLWRGVCGGNQRKRTAAYRAIERRASLTSVRTAQDDVVSN